MQAATTVEECQTCNKVLKKVVEAAKCNWADQYITTANIWEVAAWRHGHHSLHIPALIRDNCHELAIWTDHFSFVSSLVPLFTVILVLDLDYPL